MASSGLIALMGNAYYAFLNPRLPHVGESAGQASLWGVLSRARLILLGRPFVLWRPRRLGYQIGRTRRHWKVLLVVLLANCGVVAAFPWLSGSGTPYSGDQWLATEVIVVPVVEETIWRGLVFAALLVALERKKTCTATLGPIITWPCGSAASRLGSRTPRMGWLVCRCSSWRCKRSMPWSGVWCTAMRGRRQRASTHQWFCIRR